MIQPLHIAGYKVIGVDYNYYACMAARQNGIPVIRGDAYLLPFESNSISEVINCQFLNQQSKENLEYFLIEAARILAPGGRLVLVWRNDNALIHKIALALYRVIDFFIDKPAFPHVYHPVTELISIGQRIGFEMEKKEVIFSLIKWRSAKLNSLLAKCIGASYLLVLRKI